MSGNQFTTYAPRGKGTRIKRYQSVTERVYSISGITTEGGLYYSVQKQPFNSEHVIQFLKQLENEITSHLHVVWDNASIHFSKKVKAFLKEKDQAKRLKLYALPTYSPDFNPDEQVWNYLKNRRLIRKEFSQKSKLKKELEDQLAILKKKPELIRKFFKHPQVGFA